MPAVPAFRRGRMGPRRQLRGAGGPRRRPGRGPGTDVAPATNWLGTYVPAPGDRRRPGWHELAPGAGDRKRIA